MMTTLYEGAYAKLNLTLDVLGKRDDAILAGLIVITRDILIILSF